MLSPEATTLDLEIVGRFRLIRGVAESVLIGAMLPDRRVVDTLIKQLLDVEEMLDVIEDRAA